MVEARLVTVRLAKKEKIVSLFNDDDWAKLDLTWKEKPNTTPKLIDSE